MRRTNLRAWVKLVLVVSLALLIALSPYSGLSENVFAVDTLGISVSDTFQSSIYYERACEAYSQYTNPAQRFVQVALSQTGYVGGTCSGSWNGEGAGGRYTEYGRYMGQDGLDWCASFVSWCAQAAGIPKNVIPQSAGAGHWKQYSGFHRLWEDEFTRYCDYKPQIGDLALYMPYDDGRNGGTACGKNYNSYSLTAHVVIVSSVASQPNADGSWSFTVIERGNYNTVGSDQLTTKMTRGTSDTCHCGLQTPNDTEAYVVQGFYHPDWDRVWDDTPNVTFSPPVDPAYVSKQMVSDSNAVVAIQVAKPSGTNVTSMGLSLYDADDNLITTESFSVTNVSAYTTVFHAWYDINSEIGVVLCPGTTYKYTVFGTFDGYTVTSSLYSFKTTGGYTARFDANMGSGAPGSITGMTVVVPTKTPEWFGHEFLGWCTSSSAATVEYCPGDPLFLTSDLVLYAVWRTESTTADSADVVFTLGNVSGSAGETVWIPLILSSNVNLNSIAISDFAYDTNALEFNGFVEYGALITESLVGEKGVDQNKKTLVMGYLSPSKRSGSICSLSFTIKDTASENSYPITYKTVVKNSSQEIFSVERRTGSITVTEGNSEGGGIANDTLLLKLTDANGKDISTIPDGAFYVNVCVTRPLQTDGEILLATYNKSGQQLDVCQFHVYNGGGASETFYFSSQKDKISKISVFALSFDQFEPLCAVLSVGQTAS